jgi:hypothetical protein
VRWRDRNGAVVTRTGRVAFVDDLLTDDDRVWIASPPVWKIASGGRWLVMASGCHGALCPSQQTNEVM